EVLRRCIWFAYTLFPIAHRAVWKLKSHREFFLGQPKPPTEMLNIGALATGELLLCGWLCIRVSLCGSMFFLVSQCVELVPIYCRWVVRIEAKGCGIFVFHVALPPWPR